MELHVYEDKEEQGQSEEMRSVLSKRRQVVNPCTQAQMEKETQLHSHMKQIHKETHRQKVLVCYYSLTPVGNKAGGTGSCSDKVWGHWGLNSEILLSFLSFYV